MAENAERKYSPEEEAMIRDAFKNSGIKGPEPEIDNLDPETMVYLMVHLGAGRATLRTGRGTNSVQGTAELTPDGMEIKPTQVFRR